MQIACTLLLAVAIAIARPNDFYDPPQPQKIKSDPLPRVSYQVKFRQARAAVGPQDIKSALQTQQAYKKAQNTQNTQSNNNQGSQSNPSNNSDSLFHYVPFY